jgi:hypothetical protein
LSTEDADKCEPPGMRVAHFLAPDLVAIKLRAERVGPRQAGRERDLGIDDWTADRPINQARLISEVVRAPAVLGRDCAGRRPVLSSLIATAKRTAA